MGGWVGRSMNTVEAPLTGTSLQWPLFWRTVHKLIFAIFRKYTVPEYDVRAIETHIFKHYCGMRTLCKTSNSLYAALFLNKLGGKL